MSEGIVLFAYNTNMIDYIKLAVIAGKYANRHYPDKKIALITDKGSLEWFQTTENAKYIDEIFDDVVITNNYFDENKRTHYDSPWTKFTTDFKNTNKHKVFYYTPYEKTLMIDIDYILHNNFFNQVFDQSESPIVMFNRAESLTGKPQHNTLIELNSTGIKMIWSTVVYFDKSNPVTKLFFDLWGHIKDNYSFYQMLYGFPGKMFRTDYCVSIATHILNGMNDGDVIGDFNVPLINMSQFDDISKINGIDDWVFIVNDHKKNWEDSLARIKNENVHVMNKRSLDRHFTTIMEQFDG